MPRPERPKAVLALGIVCTAFGAAGILGLLPGTISLTRPEFVRMLSVPTQHDQAVLTIAFAALSMTEAVFRFVTGIGLLLMKMWGRILGIFYSIYAILFVVAMTVLQRAMHSGQPVGDEALNPWGVWAGRLAFLIIPVLLFYVLTRPYVGRAFRGEPISVEVGGADGSQAASEEVDHNPASE